MFHQHWHIITAFGEKKIAKKKDTELISDCMLTVLAD